MSTTANWSYANIAKVRPFEGQNQLTGETLYGEEYDIACTWIGESKQERADDGAEFVSRHIFFTEDARPKYLDMIQRTGFDDWEEIRSVTQWDMSFFAETPDYKLIT